MAKPNVSCLLLFFIGCVLISVTPVLARPPPPSHDYLNSSCGATRFPKVCIECLSNYNGSLESPQQFALAALTVTLNRALYTRSFLIKVVKGFKTMNAPDYQAIKDCLNQVDNGVDQLTLSIAELRQLVKESGGDDIYWHISNVESWTSAALTDATTCLDEFPGRRMGKMKAIIKEKVLNMAMATSNALALFHRFTAKYGTAHAAAKP